MSNHGRIRSHFRGKLTIKKQKINDYGYCVVILHPGNNKRKWERVNRLVALAFIPNPENLSDVNHKDLNKLNNHVSNLEWTSHSDNVKYSYEHGRKMSEASRLKLSASIKAWHARRRATDQSKPRGVI